MIKYMDEFKQYNLESNEFNQENEFNQDWYSTPNVLATQKTVIIGKNRVIADPNKGLFTNYVLRGINSTGYSTVTVFDSSLEGFHQVRTHIDVGNATLTMTSGGSKGQEMYLKIDNDTDANRTIAFGSVFVVNGNVIGSTAATAILHFISDGTKFWEVSRTTGLNQI